MSIPDVRVEVAFDSQPGDAVQSWTDVSAYVNLAAGVSVTRGRGDEYSQVQPSTCSLTLDNSDGRFTAGLSSSPYYPNVKIGRQIRVFAGATTYNLIEGDSASFEGGTTGDWLAMSGILYPNTPTLTASTTRSHDGTRSMKITWATGVASSSVALLSATMPTPGATYTFSIWVWVPTGAPRIGFGNIFGTYATSSVNDAWQRLTYTTTGSLWDLYLFNVDSATSGQVAYVDSLMANPGATADDFAGDPAPRFTGYVDEWPTTFAPTGHYSLASVTATDRLKKLGQIAELSNVVTEEICYDSPTSYYPLGEDEGATSAGDASGNSGGSLAVTQVGAGGTITFGVNTGPGTDGISAPAFAPASTSAGKYLRASLTLRADLGASLRASMLTSTTALQVIAEATAGAYYLVLRVTAAGKLQGAVGSSFLGVEDVVTSASDVDDGLTHDVVAVVNGSTLTLYLDGVSAGSGSVSGISGAFTSLSVGGHAGGDLFTGTIAHVATYNTVLSASRVAEQASMVADGAAGESSDERISRYARWAGVSTAQQNLETGSSTTIAHRDTTGVAPLTAMQDVADTEGGLLFINGVGDLTFHARSHRYNTASALTLNDIGVEDTFVVNDQQLVNDITASRDGGITYRAVNQDSIDDYGPYRQSLTLLTTSDSEVAAAAQWQAYTRSQPEPRLSSLTIDLLTDTTIRDSALALELGSRVTLPTLPDQAPDANTDVFIEGWTETISTQAWTLVCNTSPAAWSGVWALDSSTYSVLGTSTRLAY